MNQFPRLITDIGGTNARFTIETAPYKYESTQVLQSIDYPNLIAATNDYLQQVKHVNTVKSMAVVVPSPIFEDTINMVNNPWKSFSMNHFKQQMKFDNMIFLNDFHALALSLPMIDKAQLVQVGGNSETILENKIQAVIGPGTGLGSAFLYQHPQTGEYLALSSEAGRLSFAPGNEEESYLWNFAHKRYQHVSTERFLSGSGLQLIYQALCEKSGKMITKLPLPYEITQQGIDGGDFIAHRTIEIFCRMLGTAASNLAVVTNSFGGVYIGGGIIPKMLDFFVKSSFRGRFENKGRYHWLLSRIPVYVIIEEFPAFSGASYALNTYINKKYIP
jgi:glucokinase